MILGMRALPGPPLLLPIPHEPGGFGDLRTPLSSWDAERRGGPTSDRNFANSEWALLLPFHHELQEGSADSDRSATKKVTRSGPAIAEQPALYLKHRA